MTFIKKIVRNLYYFDIVFKKLVKWQQYFYHITVVTLCQTTAWENWCPTQWIHRKKLCPDVMVQKTHSIMYTMTSSSGQVAKCNYNCLTFLLPCCSINETLGISTKCYNLFHGGFVMWYKNYLVQRTNYKLASLCCIADRLKCLHGQQRS